MVLSVVVVMASIIEVWTLSEVRGSNLTKRVYWRAFLGDRSEEREKGGRDRDGRDTNRQAE